MNQLSLFFAPHATGSPCWHTGGRPDTSGDNCYVIIIRSPLDPDRSPRPPGGQADRSPHLTLATTNSATWRQPILDIFSTHGRPITFNALSVYALQLTADITSGTVFEEALWALVLERQVAFTCMAPILFTNDAATLQAASALSDDSPDVIRKCLGDSFEGPF